MEIMFYIWKKSQNNDHGHGLILNILKNFLGSTKIHRCIHGASYFVSILDNSSNQFGNILSPFRITSNIQKCKQLQVLFMSKKAFISVLQSNVQVIIRLRFSVSIGK